MADVFTSIAISPQGATLLNALQVTTTAGNVLNEVVSIGDPGNGANYAAVLASGAQLVEPGGVNTQPVSGTVAISNFPATQTVTGAVTIGNAGTVVANAGTNLNTSALALESGGNLAKIASTGGVFGATAPATGVANGVVAAITFPTAVTNGQLVGAMSDKAGRVVNVLNAPRDLIGTVSIATFTATGATGIFTAAASSFYDITTLNITSPQTVACSFTLSDGVTSYQFNLAPTGGIVNNFSSPLTMGSAAATWTGALASAGTVSFIAIYAKNK